MRFITLYEQLILCVCAWNVEVSRINNPAVINKNRINVVDIMQVYFSLLFHQLLAFQRSDLFKVIRSEVVLQKKNTKNSYIASRVELTLNTE